MYILKVKNQNNDIFYYTNVMSNNGDGWIFTTDISKAYKYSLKEEASEAYRFLNIAEDFVEIINVE